MQIKAVAYLRVSTKDQNLDRQREELEKYASDNNYIIEKYFEDKISSTKVSINKRTGFNKLKTFLFDDNNEIKSLIIHEVSRLGRKNFEVHNVIHEFSENKINIHFMDLKLSTLNENGFVNPESNIIISILSSMAENENRLLSKRIRGGLLTSAKKGFAFSSKITGYKKGKDKRPKIDELEAPMVNRMFELAQNGTTLYFISKAINKEFKREFNSKTISGIIKNPFYKGERRYLNEVVPPVPAIVTREVWKKANDFLNSRKVFTKRYRVNVNVVEGKIECYKCGSPMYQVVIEKGRTNMFKCSSKCSKISVNRPWLYEMLRYVVEKHAEKVNNQKFKNSLDKQITENDILEKELIKEKSILEEAQLKNYDRLLRGKVNESVYEKTNHNYTKELNNLTFQINECGKKLKSYREALKNKPKHFSNDLKTFKVQVKDLLHCVEVNDDFIIINIENLVQYRIPQLSGSEIGWAKRKYTGEDYMFNSPFITGINIKNCINDDDLESMIDEQISNNSSLVDNYLESPEHKKEVKNIKSLGKQE